MRRRVSATAVYCNVRPNASWHRHRCLYSNLLMNTPQARSLGKGSVCMRDLVKGRDLSISCRMDGWHTKLPTLPPLKGQTPNRVIPQSSPNRTITSHDPPIKNFQPP